MTEKKGETDLPIFVRWQEFLQWLLPVLDRFPKKARFTFTNRLINLGLEVTEDLVEARYSRHKLEILRRCNLRLEKMRVLLRLCHALKFLSNGAFAHAVKSLNGVGKMLGGWYRQQGGS